MTRFVRFWYEFVVGDDWRVAAGIAAALATSALLVALDVPAWWLLPAAVAGLLYASLRRAVSRNEPR